MRARTTLAELEELRRLLKENPGALHSQIDALIDLAREATKHESVFRVRGRDSRKHREETREANMALWTEVEHVKCHLRWLKDAEP